MPRLYKLGPRRLIQPAPPPPDTEPGARPFGRTFQTAQGQLVDQYPGFDPAEAPGIQQPTVYLDTTVPTFTGPQATPIQVTTAGQLAAAYAQADAAGGGIIELAASFVANFGYDSGVANSAWQNNAFPARTTTGWIVIRCRASQRPPGYPAPYTRITPAAGAGLPTFLGSGTGGSKHALYGPSTMHHVRFEGIRFMPGDGGSFLTTLVEVDKDAHDVVFDRCYFRAFDKYTKCRRGLALNGYRSALVDSWIEDMKEVATDAQGCTVFYSRGDLKVVNNYLEGAAEPFMCGGVNPPQGDTPTYYPQNLEFRLNHCRKPQYWNRMHPAARDYGDRMSGPHTATGWDPLTGQLTIGTGAMDTSLAGVSDWVLWYIRIVAGPGQGSWWSIGSFPSAQVVDLNGTADAPGGLMTNLHNGLPDVGSVFEVCRYHRWMTKNCFELKNCRKALVAECVFENSWNGEDSQPDAVLIKTVNQNGTLSHVYHETSDVVLWDCLVLNCFGGIAGSALPQPPGVPAHAVLIDNVLLLPGTQKFIASSTLRRRQLTWNIDQFTYSRITAPGFTHSWGEFDDGVSTSGATARLDQVTLRRALGEHGNFGFRCVGGASGFATTFDAATFVCEACGVRATSAPSFPAGFAKGSTFGFENPDQTDVYGAASWALLPSSPFATVNGGPVGVDWAQLRERTIGVRAAVPYEWGDDIADGPLP